MKTFSPENEEPAGKQRFRKERTIFAEHLTPAYNTGWLPKRKPLPNYQ